MKKKTLTAHERQAIAEKAARTGEYPSVTRLLAFHDEPLRAVARQLDRDEACERERNSDWIEEMDERQKEQRRINALPYPGLSPPEAVVRVDPNADFQQFASKDHRTATEMAVDLLRDQAGNINPPAK